MRPVHDGYGHVALSLWSVVSEHNTALKPQVTRWLTAGTPMGAALKSKLCRAVSGLMKDFTMSCPLPLLECVLHTLDSFCDKREDCLNDAVTYEFGTGTQCTEIISKTFKAYASGVPSLYDIITDASFSRKASQLVSDIRAVGCQPAEWSDS